MGLPARWSMEAACTSESGTKDFREGGLKNAPNREGVMRKTGFVGFAARRARLNTKGIVLK